MISKTFNRYIWLLNLLLQHPGLTFEEIADRWKHSCMGDGNPLAKRTFHVHREAIAESFDVEIKCDLSTCKYYVSSPELLKSDKIRQWLLNSFTVSNMIDAGRNMKDRILLEEIPAGGEYLQLVMEAMQLNKKLQIDYQPFKGNRQTFHFHPYAMKVYHQRWYVVGYLEEQNGIRNVSLDRVQTMQLEEDSFLMPDDFEAERYYAHTVGIFVNEALQPQRVVLRVYGVHVEYMRSLPLHFSQQEIAVKEGEYSDFEYYLCLTPELTSQLLAMGEKVEVREPQELKDSLLKRVCATWKRYK